MDLTLAQFGVVVSVSALELESAERLGRLLARRLKRLKQRRARAIVEVFGARPIHSEDCT